MFKKFVFFLVFVLLVLSFIANTSFAEPKYTFGVATYICTHGWSIDNWSGMQEAAERLNIKLIRTLAERDVVKQANDIDDLIERDVDGMIIMLGNPDTMTKAIAKCQDNGIPIAFTNGPFLCDGLNINICTNNYDAGKLIAEGLCKGLDYKGNVVIIDYPGLACTANRCEGAREVIAKYPDIKIIADEPIAMGAGVTEKSMKIMEDLLIKYPSGQIQGVFSPADTVGAIGPSAAIDAAGRSKEIKIYSMDSLDQVADMIRSGETAIAASYCQRPKEMGRLCVEFLDRFLDGERAIPRQVFLEGILYTIDNIPATNAELISHQ
jgi:ribose transport system substrate-binding protein